MRLSEALALVQPRQEIESKRKLFLACGFEPLHLKTFLRAHFAQRFPVDDAEVLTGLYGDLGRTLAAAVESPAEAAAVIVEGSDLDPRLGCRSSGGWGPSVAEDILATSHKQCALFLRELEQLASKMPIALAIATLPIPLFGHTAGCQMSRAEAELERLLAALVADAASLRNVRVIHRSRLGRISPSEGRSDVNLELAAAFPYTLAHASALALQSIRVLYPPVPLKGLITDLDETLWSGIVGEIGAASVSWSLAEHSQIHGLYQQQLRQLAEMGVLLAVASKNEDAVVQDALARPDLYLARDAFFPVIANWKPKSQAVAEILRVWNVGAESVVYVDDSPMEIDEVRSAFPAMTFLQFPRAAPGGIIPLLEQLRDLFGKPSLTGDDSLRRSSIVANAQFQEAAGTGSADEFIKGLRAKVTFDPRKDSSNGRLLELINKTNQFNLNGTRISEGEWLRFLSRPASLAVSVSYEDKFGPLGVVGVVAGRQSGDRLDVQTWVLSCRAFSRAIELHVLEYLFRSTGATAIALEFRATERNRPLSDFLDSLGLPTGSGAECVLGRKSFLQAGHSMPHEVVISGEPA